MSTFCCFSTKTYKCEKRDNVEVHILSSFNLKTTLSGPKRILLNLEQLF